MSTEVKILGKSFSIRSEFDESFTTETADIVNSKMREVLGKSGNLSTEKIAILTAMNLAGELLRERKDHRTLRDTLRRKADRLMQLIDEHL